MSPSAEWHSRLGPLDFRVGIRHFELRGVFPEQPRALPGDAAGPPPGAGPPAAARIRAAEGEVPDREPEGGASG